MFSSCFGSRRRLADEEEPLLSQYDDETSLQRQLHQKLHTYQMLRALSKGFMPSNEQAIVNLRTLLSAEILNPDNTDLSDSGRALVHYTKQFITQLIELLQHKNSHDQIQDFIWCLARARVSVDMEHIAERASRAKSQADTAALYKSVQTVGSLLLTNYDFRLFLSDLNIVGREVFKDTAFALSEASKEAGKRLEPSQAEQDAMKKPGEEANGRPTQGDVAEQVAEVGDVVVDSASKVATVAENSIADKLKGAEGDTMLERLKRAVTKLRQRRDYSDSVSTVSLLLKRYTMVYSRVGQALQDIDNDVHSNPAMDKAAHNLWLLIRSFGDAKEWDELESRFKRVMDHGKNDPEFDKLITELGNATQEMFTDPSFFDHAEDRFQDLRARSTKLAEGSAGTLREDVDGLLTQVRSTFYAVLRDQDIAKLIKTATTIGKILSPANQYANSDLIQDSLNVFVPLLVQSISYIPIPRVEISTPDVDLLLENLILEPGTTINHSSFLPYKLRVETYNDLEIRKARFRTASAIKSLVRVSIDGFSVRAEEVGFWMRAHSGILRLVDEGISSFALDERGIDIQLDMEIGKDRLDKILSLRSVKVRIHKLNWTLRRSKFSILAWLFKPLLKPIIRSTLEMQIATAIGEGLKFANRELLYARERLRATRIADPDDLTTFVKAVLARLTPPDDPDVHARVGVVEPGKGVFKGVYAPGSIVKLWNEEGEQAAQRIRENDEGGWRNSVFDVHARLLG
ncbi:bactericidal permeability-increasing protein [Podospora aff. communis PSN243]|uniref:Bactericidal permeability-increasing protein n=1 Tax=Podospora aff. communis PSN243 TaxID=3040156 RepID=A0AAV9G916_9PEZI|nr:bactericidal permeability-increasing protein [Podospora aff. communis PSN243]